MYHLNLPNNGIGEGVSNKPAKHMFSNVIMMYLCLLIRKARVFGSLLAMIGYDIPAKVTMPLGTMRGK